MLEFYLISVLFNLILVIGIFFRDKDDLDEIEFPITLIIFVILGIYVYLLIILALLIAPVVHRIRRRGGLA